MTVSNSVTFSSTGNLPIGGSAVEIMAAVEMMIVQEYDDQLRSMAQQMKQNTKMKKAIRQHIAELNQMAAKPVKDGKIDLNANERRVYLSRPTFSWNPDANNGIGEVDTRTNNTSFISGSKKYTKETIEAEIEKYQMQLDDLNGDSEQIQTELSRISNERKLCFDTVAKMLSRYYESAGNITRSL